MICVAVAVPNSGEGAEGRGGWETEADPGPLIWHRQHLVREVGLFLFLFFFFLVIEPVQYFLLESLCLIGRGVEIGTAPEKWKGNRGYVLSVVFAFGVNCWDLQLCWAKHSWNGRGSLHQETTAEPEWWLLPRNAGHLFGFCIFFTFICHAAADQSLIGSFISWPVMNCALLNMSIFSSAWPFSFKITKSVINHPFLCPFFFSLFIFPWLGCIVRSAESSWGLALNDMQPWIILDISAFIFQGEYCCTGVDLAYPCGLREAGPRNSGGAAVRRGKGEDDAGAGDQGADGTAQERHEQKRSTYCIGRLLSICLLSPFSPKSASCNSSTTSGSPFADNTSWHMLNAICWGHMLHPVKS